MPKKYDFDPEAIKDYKFDWSDWLKEDDTIKTNTITISSSKLKEIAGKREETDTYTTVWLYGADLIIGENHKVTNHVVTMSGREEDKTMIFRIKPG